MRACSFAKAWRIANLFWMPVNASSSEDATAKALISRRTWVTKPCTSFINAAYSTPSLRISATLSLAAPHIDETTLAAFEVMRGDGTKAHIIESTLQTAAGRELVMHRKVEDLLQQLRNLCNRRAPFVFHTGSKQTSSKMSPVNLARMVRRWWPDAGVTTSVSADFSLSAGDPVTLGFPARKSWVIAA